VSGGFRRRANGGVMRLAMLGMGLAAALVAATLIPHQILAASRANASTHAGVRPLGTAHQLRHRAHDGTAEKMPKRPRTEARLGSRAG
jgi:hypothetical protein